MSLIVIQILCHANIPTVPARVEVVDMFPHCKKTIIFHVSFAWCLFECRLYPSLHILVSIKLHPARFRALTFHFFTKLLRLLHSTSFWMCLHDYLTVDTGQKVRHSMSFFCLYIYIWALLVLSFHDKTATPQSMRPVVIPYTTADLLAHVMIVVILCVLLRNRQSDTQESRYPFCFLG